MKKKLLVSLFLLFSASIFFFANNTKKETTIKERPIAASHRVKKTRTYQVKSDESMLYVVARAIDGDTIELESGEKVRYIGIDTPETKHPKKAVQCFGKEAHEKNKELVEGKYVRLERDVSERDKYGRLLRYVYVVNTDSNEEIFVNAELVSKGYAHASTFPPDVKFQEIFLDGQDFAREHKLGLWGGCY